MVMAKNFSSSEKRILELFEMQKGVDIDNEYFIIENAGKPTTKKGEPKTDIYAKVMSGSGKVEEIKISFKQENADFIENKTSAERAEQILGPDWEEIVLASTMMLYEVFESKPLIYIDKQAKTEAGSFALGWKYELLNKHSGKLSGQVTLTKDQVMDVYAGTHLSADKRHAMVNGKIIPNSGVANAILITDSAYYGSCEEVLKDLIPIEEYVEHNGDVYFACKALNYRSFEDKYDGARPLAVYVDWKVVNGKLDASLVFDRPLLKNGRDAYEKLKKALGELGIKDASQITDETISPNVKVYRKGV